VAKHRKRRSSARRRRHRNPIFGFGGRRPHRSHRRRRHNPGFGFRDIGAQLLWGTAGGVAALSVPGLVASAYNTGWTGYLLNGATAFLGRMIGVPSSLARGSKNGRALSLK